MGQPVATQGAQVVALDIHIGLVPTPGGPVPTPLPHPFSGQVQLSTVPTVKIGGQPVAVQDSVAINSPPHLPTPPAVSIQAPPANQGKVMLGSVTAFAGGKGIARIGDQVITCNDPADQPVGSLVAPAGTVFAG